MSKNVLEPWLQHNDEALAWLRAFAERSGDPFPPADAGDLYCWYALGRANDLLLRRFQRGCADGKLWEPPVITMDEYLAFVTALGMTVDEQTTFSPFYHEIVDVTQADEDDHPVELLTTYWPCLMHGNMLFSRAGVHVKAGRQWLRKELAESSLLYWAYTRRNRECEDLSHGWGSNSQWSTDFRRDYRIGDIFYFNVDGVRHVTEPDPPNYPPNLMTLEERIELVVHRCFVTIRCPHDESFPYNYRWSQSSIGVTGSMNTQQSIEIR